MYYCLILFLFYFILPLIAFQPQAITPSPVVGYKEISFFDELYQQQRNMFIWYPIGPQVKGSASSNFWDVFDIATDAPIANPN